MVRSSSCVRHAAMWRQPRRLDQLCTGVSKHLATAPFLIPVRVSEPQHNGRRATASGHEQQEIARVRGPTAHRQSCRSGVSGAKLPAQGPGSIGALDSVQNPNPQKHTWPVVLQIPILGAVACNTLITRSSTRSQAMTHSLAGLLVVNDTNFVPRSSGHH